MGLENYRTVIADPSFQKVFVNSLLFVGVNVVAQVLIGLGGGDVLLSAIPRSTLSARIAARILDAPCPRRGRPVEMAVCDRVWGRQPRSRGHGLHRLADPLALRSSVALTSVTIANIWFGMPFSMILIAAALTSVPNEHYEAATLDGAGAFARFRYITLPAIMPALLAVACLVTIYTMRAFDLIFAMTQGGPLDASNVLPLLSYQFSFQQFQFGIGSAIGSFSFVIVFAVALLYVRTLKKEAIG